MKTTSFQGFTLIELLVVISIIGLLASIVFSSLASARYKAMDSKRVSELVSVQQALELYYATNGVYPTTGFAWLGTCNFPGWTTATTNYIPGLVPTYMNALPRPPASDGATVDCYMYLSDGANYKFLEHAAGATANYTYAPGFLDPPRDGGSDLNAVEGTGSGAWARSVYSNATFGGY